MVWCHWFQVWKQGFHLTGPVMCIMTSWKLQSRIITVYRPSPSGKLCLDWIIPMLSRTNSRSRSYEAALSMHVSFWMLKTKANVKQFSQREFSSSKHPTMPSSTMISILWVSISMMLKVVSQWGKCSTTSQSDQILMLSLHHINTMYKVFDEPNFFLEGEYKNCQGD